MEDTLNSFAHIQANISTKPPKRRKKKELSLLEGLMRKLNISKQRNKQIFVKSSCQYYFFKVLKFGVTLKYGDNEINFKCDYVAPLPTEPFTPTELENSGSLQLSVFRSTVWKFLLKSHHIPDKYGSPSNGLNELWIRTFSSVGLWML